MDNMPLEYGHYDYRKIRMENVNSFFLDPFYDDAIMGIDKLTRSVIYSFDDMVQLEIYSRYELGEINPDYDTVDDDLIKIAQDAVLHYFRIYQEVEDCAPPTLFEEFDRSKYDRYAELNKTTSGNIDTVDPIDDDTIKNLKPRMFSFEQLSKIIDENIDVYTGWTNLNHFENEHVFVLIPKRVLDYALEEDVEPCIRSVVTILDNPSEWISFQDMTFDQWEQGQEISETICETLNPLV